MPPPYQLVLFDFDGTLVDTVRDIARHANDTLRSYGHPEASVEDVKLAIGLGVHELFRTLAPALAEDAAVWESAVQAFRAAYRKEPVIDSAMFPSVEEVLKGPLRPVKKAVVTNKPQDVTLQIMDKLGMRGHFLEVIGMHAGYPAKPDPASTRHLMDRFAAPAERTVYVGDSLVDADTSRAAGIDFAWVDYGYQVLERSIPKWCFSNAREWAQLVR